MDDRAFNYLSEADAEVQEAVFSDFQPKRRHLDDDYSASVTTYVKAVKAKVQAGGALSVDGRGEDALLEGFRRRYPMDSRAFEYLCSADPAVKRKVVDTFRPKFEGEADYSGLVTSFVKSCSR
ncbi:unnamed protein product [Effrenium voratum]|nr:unnamed protein product [Effrenium voratum]